MLALLNRHTRPITMADDTPSIVPGEIPIPHGPGNARNGDLDGNVDDHDNLAGSTDYERRIFSHVTRPDDSYTPDGVYWADLPLQKRFKFVSSVDAQAAKEELKTIGGMMKKDPLSPLGWYFRNAIIPGAGLGLEGYVLFSIGNLEPLFGKVWPECWENNTVCSKNWVAAVTYLEIIGIMVGQAGVGVSPTPAQLAHLFLLTTRYRSLVTGLDDDGVSSKMLSLCS